jgi:hypothetical protein
MSQESSNARCSQICRLEDSELIYPTLSALRDSDSLSDFYGKQIRDSRNQVREIAGCVARVRETLGREELRFQEYVGKIMVAIRDVAVSLTTSAALHQGTLDVVNGWWIQLAGRVDQSDEVRSRFARREYVHSSYFYNSYVLNQAIDYVERCVTHIDQNDFEDARPCQNLVVHLL